MVEKIPEFIAIGVALLAVLAEWVHARRVRRLQRLAFGPTGRAAAWTWAVPLMRIGAIAIASWGFASLLWVVEARVHNAG